MEGDELRGKDIFEIFDCVDVVNGIRSSTYYVGVINGRVVPLFDHSM